MTDPKDVEQESFQRLTAKIVAAYVANNTLVIDDLPDLISQIHDALRSVKDHAFQAPEKLIPAVPVRKSVTPDYIICLEDGKAMKMLKRHLRNAYDMTPEEYRARWGLPSDYPMVAPNYSKRRSDFAKTIGLGRGAGANRKGRGKKDRLIGSIKPA